MNRDLASERKHHSITRPLLGKTALSRKITAKKLLSNRYVNRLLRDNVLIERPKTSHTVKNNTIRHRASNSAKFRIPYIIENKEAIFKTNIMMVYSVRQSDHSFTQSFIKEILALSLSSYHKRIYNKNHSFS